MRWPSATARPASDRRHRNKSQKDGLPFAQGGSPARHRFAGLRARFGGRRRRQTVFRSFKKTLEMIRCLLLFYLPERQHRTSFCIFYKSRLPARCPAPARAAGASGSTGAARQFACIQLIKSFNFYPVAPLISFWRRSMLSTTSYLKVLTNVKAGNDLCLKTPASA